MSPYGTLRTGGFCLFDNKIYLIPFPPHQKALEYFCDPHLPLFAVNCPQTPPPPLYSVNDEWSTLHSPWNSCDLRPTPAMNNELRGIGESEGFVCFTITVTSFPSKALEYFYDSPPPPPIGGQFSTVPLYTLLATTTVHCSPPFTSNPSHPSELKTSHPCPPPPVGDEWWLLPYVKYFSWYLISRQALLIVWWQRKISLCYSRVQIKRQLRWYPFHTLLYRPCPNHTSRWISLLNHTSRRMFLTSHASREKE